MNELATSPHLRIRGVDAAVGRMGAPLGRLRRRTLFMMSSRAGRRDESRAAEPTEIIPAAS